MNEKCCKRLVPYRAIYCDCAYVDLFGRCKYFHLDGMFGFWCEKDHDWTLVNEICSDFER